MNTPDHKTPHQKPAGPPRGVFGYEVRGRNAFWREMSQASVVMFVLAVGVGAVLVTMVTGWIYDWHGNVKAQRDADAVAAITVPQLAPPEPTRRRIIDGVAIPESQPTGGLYYALMIDNLYVARPQSGISKASVVYEAPVEGGITRLMAVYPDDTPVDEIGPVRSARPYYLDWAAEYDALYTHVGGSPEALDLLKQNGMRDLNEFFNGPTFWRSKQHTAPHNVFTDTERLAAINEKRYGVRDVKPLDGWKFKEDAPEADRPAKQQVLIDYGGSTVNVTWTYDAKTNTYARKQGSGGIEKDGDVPIAAKNILVQEAKVTIIDSYGRRRVDTVSKGDAVMFLDGLSIHGSWTKETRTGRTRFYDGAGNEIELNAGQTWVEVVPIGTDVIETGDAADAATADAADADN